MFHVEQVDPASLLMEGGLRLGIPLSPHTVARLVRYLQELQHWNTKMNLTGLTDVKGIISKHFLDSLAAFKLLQFPARPIQPDHAQSPPGRRWTSPGWRVLDVGSGAGFPGLVLKLHQPDLALTLIEPATKKAAFLHYIIGLLGLTDVEVVIKRIEDFTPGQPGYGVVTSRALALEVVLAAAPRLLHSSGRVLLYRVTPMETAPAGYRLVQQISFVLPFVDVPRTMTLLEPVGSA